MVRIMITKLDQGHRPKDLCLYSKTESHHVRSNFTPKFIYQCFLFQTKKQENVRKAHLGFKRNDLNTFNKSIKNVQNSFFPLAYLPVQHFY